MLRRYHAHIFEADADVEVSQHCEFAPQEEANLQLGFRSNRPSSKQPLLHPRVRPVAHEELINIIYLDLV